MNTIETSICNSIHWLLDNRTVLKAALAPAQIQEMNAILTGLADALNESIDSDLIWKSSQLTKDPEAFAGTFQTHKDYIAKGIQIP